MLSTVSIFLVPAQNIAVLGDMIWHGQPALSQVPPASKPPASAPARAHGLPLVSLAIRNFTVSPRSPLLARAAGSPAAGAVRWPQAQRRACTMTSKISNPPPFKVGFSARFSFCPVSSVCLWGLPSRPSPPSVAALPSQNQRKPSTYVSTQHSTGTH